MNKENKLQNNAGFTLIEVVISLSIATFIIGGVALFSVNSMKANMKSQAMQETIDNARFMMDNLAKKIRTSSNVVVSDDGKELFFVDNLTSAKYCYEFVPGSDGDIIQMKEFRLLVTDDTNMMLNEDDYNDVTSCSDSFSGPGGMGTPVEVVGNSKVDIGGHFELIDTVIDSDNPRRGFVRMNVDIVYKKGLVSNDPSDSAEAHLQTGVSILDYTREAGIFGN